jgi:long-chain acyl-CoA synthetase
MYTSGSTGKPKGVVMQHSQLIAGIAGMVQNVQLRPGKEVYVSFLPLAHILALQVENVLLSVGATLCYTDAHDLSRALPMYQPTVFGGVPKVFEMLKTGLEKKLHQQSVVMQTIFSTLLSWKTWVVHTTNGVGDTPISNKFFDKIAAKVFGGNQVQFAISGGGPISAELFTFVRILFHIPVVQGYALTETCVGGCFQSLEDRRTNVVGPPVSCVEIALQSEPDITDSHGNPYLHTDTKSVKGESILGRGEICMRGPCVSLGYYRNPDQTKQDYDEEGFFHTGDIGQFTHDGVIQIIDRKKNIVKLKGGEYVALESMETSFVGSKYVNTVCVIGNGDLDVPLAIVAVNTDTLQDWAQKQGINYKTMDDLVTRSEARNEVLQSMKQEGKKAGLSKLELRIKDCCLVHTEWKPGYGMTASMKLDRRSIQKIHANELKTLYQRNGIIQK